MASFKNPFKDFVEDVKQDADLIGYEFREALDGLDHDFLDLSQHITSFPRYVRAKIVATLAGAIAGFKSVKRASGIGLGSGQ